MLEIYESDDATLVDDLVIPNAEAGGESDEVELHVWNEKGNDAGQARANVRLVDQVEHPSVSGTFVSTGFPPVDQLWMRGKIVGFDNTGDPTFTVQNTDWMPLGAFASQLLPTIPANCAVYIKRKLRIPSDAAQVTWRHGLSAIADEYAAAVPAQLTDVDRGIFHGVGNAAESHLVRGGAVTASGSPDDEVHVAAAEVVIAGHLYGFAKTDITGNQTDGAAAALTLGNSYYGVISFAASGPHLTKGAQGDPPELPAAPAGEPLARTPYVLVQYQAGPSVIETADLEGEAFYGRFYCSPGSGRQVKIHPHALGAIAGGTWRYATAVQLVSGLTASDTSYIWQLASGRWEDTLDETPPESTAILWWEVDCDGSSVTAIRDRRTYAGRTKTIVLRGAYPGGAAPQLVDEISVEEERLELEIVAFHLSDNGGGASGQAQIDVRKNGTTIFTSFASDDQRPAIPFDATVLRAADGIAEVRSLRRGDRLSLYTVDDPTGGNPDRLEVHLVCRVP